MPNSLFPGFIKVDYHSIFSPHVMILPVNTIDVDEGDPGASTIEVWIGGTIDWNDMVDALLTEAADSMPNNASFDTAILFTVESPTAIPVPIASHTVDIAGTVAPASTNKATQLTLTARDGGQGLGKLVLLDFESSDDFSKYSNPSGRSLTGLWGEWSLGTNGWSTRKGGRPTTFLHSTATLNEKLRRSYHLT